MFRYGDDDVYDRVSDANSATARSKISLQFVFVPDGTRGRNYFCSSINTRPYLTCLIVLFWQYCQTSSSADFMFNIFLFFNLINYYYIFLQSAMTLTMKCHRISKGIYDILQHRNHLIGLWINFNLCAKIIL